MKNFKKFDTEFALTKRLRVEAGDSLIAAAQAAGAQRVIVQSYGGWTYERTGDALKTESDRFDPSPPANQVQSLAAIRHLEEAALSAAGLTGVVLRYASFYGPGTSLSEGSDIVATVRERKLPIVGAGTGVWSFIHIEDAASATAAAVERGDGIYNIVDDQPVPAREWIPALAEVLGAKPPRHVPVWLARLAAGEVGVAAMTQIRGMSNAKAKRDLAWAPDYPSVREGFATGLFDGGGPR
jgi:nucleoside-diphosphate-sugar epimerase